MCRLARSLRIMAHTTPSGQRAARHALAARAAAQDAGLLPPFVPRRAPCGMLPARFKQHKTLLVCHRALPSRLSSQVTPTTAACHMSRQSRRTRPGCPSSRARSSGRAAQSDGSLPRKAGCSRCSLRCFAVSVLTFGIAFSHSLCYHGGVATHCLCPVSCQQRQAFFVQNLSVWCAQDGHLSRPVPPVEALTHVLQLHALSSSAPHAFSGCIRASRLCVHRAAAAPRSPPADNPRYAPCSYGLALLFSLWRWREGRSPEKLKPAISRSRLQPAKKRYPDDPDAKAKKAKSCENL